MILSLGGAKGFFDPAPYSKVALETKKPEEGAGEKKEGQAQPNPEDTEGPKDNAPEATEGNEENEGV